MTTVDNVLGSIAVAKYRKWAKSPSELKEAFKNAILAINSLMIVKAELDNFVEMGVDVIVLLKLGPNMKRKIKSFTGRKIPKTMDEFVEAVSDYDLHRVEMLVRYSEGAYELEAQCIPYLVEKSKRKGTREILPIQIDLAFAECAGFLDAVFVGGMGCERILSPRPLKSKPSAHEIMVNVSKIRTQLTDRLRDSLKRATKEVLIAGWLGRFIIPDFKSCVERGVELKLITHKPQEAEGTKGATDKAEAFKELKQFLRADNVRLLPSCHARMVLIDERIVFVGSMDLDSEALAERDEAAIISDDDEVVGKARQFFEELFSKGAKPTW